MEDYKEVWSNYYDEGLAAGKTEGEAGRYADDKLAEWYADLADQSPVISVRERLTHR